MRTLLAVGLVGLLSGPTSLFATDIENAPEAFTYDSQMVVPADFQRVDLTLEINYSERTAIGRALISFEVAQVGYPMFDLVRTLRSVAIDGMEMSTDMAPNIYDPDDATQFRVVKQVVEPGEQHTLEIEYDLTSEISFSSGRVRAGFFMSDLRSGGRGFWEQYGPASFEWDHFTQVVDVNVTGVSRDHVLYANGEITEMGENSWRVVYPGYFTTSSFYFHLTETGRFVERTDTYEGLERDIEVKVYADSSSLANSGLRNSLSVLEELENSYGPFTHPKALVYVTSGGGGMEYGGATMTSMRALEHEFTHFWFARGVMPANGNAGWIDEAIASWRDNGYPRASRPPSGSPHNLGGFSQYRRDTTRDAYTLGAGFISELDRQFEDFENEGRRGMRGILRELFTRRQQESITIQYFKAFLEEATGADLTATFERYVYGRGERDPDCDGVEACRGTGDQLIQKSLHPRPYTPAELLKYR